MKKLKAIIIAGGLGTRLRPLTNTTPKPIVPVVNLPFVVHQIELLARHGVAEIVLNLHYLSAEIKKVLGDGREWGIKLRYSIEEHPLGTAGAVKNAEEFFGDELLVIFNGDVLTDFDVSKIAAYHQEKNALVTLTLTEVEDPTAFGLILTDKDGRVTKFIEKPSWDMVTTHNINAGLYIVDPVIFKQVPKGQPYSFERELYPSLLEQGAAIYGYPSKDYWLDIGNPLKYKEAHRAILKGDVTGVRVRGKRVDDCCLVGEDVKMGVGAEIKDCTVLGEHVTVGEHSVLDRTIVWKGTKIGKRVHLSDCILGYNCVVEDEAFIGRGVVLADGSVVKKATRMSAQG
ncbi:MAG: NDP-sugar synthase [Candidatus Margulisiibacteriota bacterium]